MNATKVPSLEGSTTMYGIPDGLKHLAGKIMDVENPRGRAYAARNRAAYRRAKP